MEVETKNIKKKTIKNMERYERKYLFKYYPQTGNFIKTIS